MPVNIPLYKDLYMVSNTGKVKSNDRVMFVNRGNGYKSFKKGRMLLLNVVKGYENITLCSLNGIQKTYKVHRLVALTFIPNPDNKPEVNHKDGVRDNNFANNLEWVTTKENCEHAFKTLKRKGSSFGKFGFNNKKSKPVKQIDKNGNTIGVYGCCRMAAEMTGLSKTTVCLIAKGKIKSNKSFIYLK